MPLPKRRAGRFLVILVLLAAGCCAKAQNVPYCNVTGIDVQQLANGVKITIQADGLMAVQTDVADYFNLEAFQLGQWDNFAKPVTVLPFRITNARSKVGSVADIGVYPASHVEIAITPQAQAGIGLDLRVVLFDEVIPISMEVGNWQLTMWWQNKSKPAAKISMTPDKRSLIVMLMSDRRVEAPAKLRVPPPGAPKELSVARTGDRLSVHALNADVRDLVKEVSAASGRSILAADDLSRSVSLNLPDVTVAQILEALAQSYGLSVVYSGSTARVGEGRIGSLTSFGAAVTEQIRLQNITAFAARISLPEFLVRYVRVNDLENSLTVSGPKALVDKIRADLAKIDVPTPQIEVATTVVEFSSNHDFEAIAELSGRLRDGEVGMNTATGDLRYLFAGRLPDSFQSTLSALESKGRATVKGRSKTVVLGGRTAELFAGRQQLVKVEYYDQLEGAYTGRIIQLDLGYKVQVQAWTDGRGTVIARVHPEVGSAVERDSRTGMPTVATRSAESTVLLNDGDTLVVGGLNIDQEDRLSRRLSLDLLGLPDLAPKRSRSRSELVFFITARVVAGKPLLPRRVAAADSTENKS